MLAFGLAFFGYYGLLIFADLTRPEPLGLTLQIQQSGLGVRAVDADSPAARAGLAPGDRIVSANSHPTKSRLDWISVEMNLRTGEPLRLEIERGDASPDVSPAARKRGRRRCDAPRRDASIPRIIPAHGEAS